MLWGCRLSGARFFLGLNLVCPLSNGNRGRSPHPPPETTSSFFSVKCIRSTPEYFAERLFKAMKVRDGFDVNEVRGRGGLCPPRQDSWASPCGPLAQGGLRGLAAGQSESRFPR